MLGEMLLYFSGQNLSQGSNQGCFQWPPWDLHQLLLHCHPLCGEQAVLLRLGWGWAAGPARSLVHLDTTARRISDCFMQADTVEEEKKYANGETFCLIMIIQLLQRDLK